MRLGNPACYECPKGKSKLHRWRRNQDGTASCTLCHLGLTEPDANEVFAGEPTGYAKAPKP